MKLLILSPLLVMSLKRLLVGSISLSDSQLDEENGEDQSDGTSQEIDHSQWTGKLVCAFISFLAKRLKTVGI